MGQKDQRVKLSGPKVVASTRFGRGGCGQGRKAEGADDGGAFGPDQAACLKEGKIIDKAGADQGGGEGAARLDQDAGQAFGGQAAEGFGQVEMWAAGGNVDDAGPCGMPSVAGGIGGGGTVEHPDRVLLRRLAKAAVGRGAQLRIQKQAQGLVRWRRCRGPSGRGHRPERWSRWSARHHGRAASACTLRRAAGPVIQRLSPEAVAMRPSRVLASFSVTKGRPWVTRFRTRPEGRGPGFEDAFG